MHMDPLIEVQNQKPRTTLRVETLLREAERLSPEERLQFFPRWMESQNPSTRVALFLTWMATEKDDKLKTTLFVSWMQLESGNGKLLREIVIKATAVLVPKGFTKRDYAEIERWIEVVVEKDDGRSTDQIAHACKNHFRFPEKMVPFLKKIVRIKKENLRLKKRKREKVGTGQIRPSYDTSATKRLLAENLYSVKLPPAEIERSKNVTPAPLAEAPSLDCQRRIEDYDALIAPHRPLIGQIGSMEALAELLRILYDGGEVPLGGRLIRQDL